MNSFGWANAWRSWCWARLKNADKAYQLVVNNLKPSVNGSNGNAMNLFDIYEVETGRGIFQIEAQFCTAGDGRDAGLLATRTHRSRRPPCPPPGRRPARCPAWASAAALSPTSAGRTAR